MLLILDGVPCEQPTATAGGTDFIMIAAARSLDSLGKVIVRFTPRLSRESSCANMRTDRTDLMQGTLELLVLKTLSREPMHGYGIAQRIHEAVEDLLRVEDGSLYPALY